jgi:hypothetical protein
MMMKNWCLMCAVSAGIALAQTANPPAPGPESEGRWYVGAEGGWGFSNDLTVKSSAGSATTGLKSGGAVGVFAGEDTYNYFGAEARYLYRFSDFKLSSGSTNVNFGGHTHIAEGVIVAHFRPRHSRVRPFAAFGGGIKVLQGTGIESAAQPLGRFAALTATREILPTADVGFGVKVDFHQHLRLRFEVRDYISASPSKVIAPAPGASLSGILNDVAALAGVAYAW